MSVEKKLLHYVGQAISHYKLIQSGDRILVGLSGGKDSWTLLDILRKLKRRAKVVFKLKVGIVDFGFFDVRPLLKWLEEEEIEYEVLKAELTFGAYKNTPCVLCSRLRRGILYTYAREQQYNKLALGHHREDLNISLLMSIFYNGKIASMSPKWKASSDITVIRPMIYCQEQDIIKYAEQQKFPLLANNCPLRGHFGGRERVSSWLNIVIKDNPKVASNVLRSMQNLHPDHLADKRWWSFYEEDM